MKPLRNYRSREELTRELAAEKLPRTTLSFYRYVKIAEPAEFRDVLYKEWSALGVLGRIYVAAEGINAQLNVPEKNYEAFVANLELHAELKEMPLKIALEHGESFIKLTIKVKEMIVADGLTPESYDIENVGTHLNAEEFHRLASEPETIIVDMRNNYESRIGRFEGAICPDVETFRESLPIVKDMLKGKEDKKVLLYCTGGVRCEKASSFLRHYGFKDVNQLHGGIIWYGEEMKKKGIESRFKGKNFVFDGRISEPVTADVLTICDQCGEASDHYVNCRSEICNLLFIQCTGCVQKNEGCCSDACRDFARQPIKERRRLRAGRAHTPPRYHKEGAPLS